MRYRFARFVSPLAAMLAVMLGALLPPPNADAQTLTTIYSFFCAVDQNNCADGLLPIAGLVQATNGVLYGMTSVGGVNDDTLLGGTAFKITASGMLTPLYSFCTATGCPNSDDPQGGLVQATNGDLYGTTSDGGYGGTVFKMTLAGALTTLHTFAGGSDGDYPYAALIQAINGDLYGTTLYGGANDSGTIFKITPSGTLSIVYSFCAQSGCPDGRGPGTGLIQATNGDLYGTTGGGGANNSGTVFKITTSGTLTTLYTFCAISGCPDGLEPNGLIQATNGNLYGTTAGGGAYHNAGTVFQITPSGTLTTLYSFCAQSACADGVVPFASLMQATDGNLYGTTYHGGAKDLGTVFQITPTGTLTSLYSFCAQSACADGEQPWSGLVQATNGNLYGTAYSGGAHHGGTVYQLALGLGPFVKTLPVAAGAGTAVIIYGTDLAGATSVTFNGRAATFTMASATAIKTTVPAGAASGTVKVTTPSGTLSSNVPFRVVN
jgi:uncharacterized repeat protein (TIGR03803 family)